MVINRRTLLAASGAALLARPALAQDAKATTLRFIPQADVTVLDPLGTTAYPTRNHGHMCWDTLYGIDADFRPQPRDAWFDALDLAAQQRIGREIQTQAFQDVPYIPLGQYFTDSAYRRGLVDIRRGIPLPLNVRRS